MDYFPVFMELHAQRCVVVGGGEVAARKARLLLSAGAQVTVVAPELADAMRQLLASSALTHVERGYRASDLDAAALVIAATGERALNAAVSRDARARQLPVNVVDDPELCSIIVPAIVERSPILIAVGTAGSAPVLARLLRGRIEALIPEHYGELAALSAVVRGEVRTRLQDIQERRRFWEEVFEGEIAELVFRGERDAAERAIRAKLEGGSQPDTGVIYLIGAGPNDPELVSFRALRFLQRADLVVVAPGVSPAIAALSRRDASHWTLSDPDWDKEPAADGVRQRLAACVSAGERACVLALGDAFRRDEGAAFAGRLVDAGLPCVVVPGVSAT